MKYSKELHDQLRKRDKDSDASYVQCLLDEIERLQAERRWIPMSERLPEAGVNILTCNSLEEIVVLSLGHSKDYWTDADGFEEDDPGVITHWMPLPEPPEEK